MDDVQQIMNYANENARKFATAQNRSHHDPSAIPEMRFHLNELVNVAAYMGENMPAVDGRHPDQFVDIGQRALSILPYEETLMGREQASDFSRTVSEFLMPFVNYRNAYMKSSHNVIDA